VQKRIGEALDALRESFAPVKLFDVKKLKGLEDTFRIRIGDWRIIYEFRRKESTGCRSGHSSAWKGIPGKS
jgi:mRNA interferase RelE/StbE